VQGLAAAGPGALVTRAQPVFQAVKRAGIAYLAYLGVQALRSARAGHYPESAGGDAGSGWRQGFSVRLATE
jgi:threonine/homoserine/homoserine lactone efflux protein